MKFCKDCKYCEQSSDVLGPTGQPYCTHPRLAEAIPSYRVTGWAGENYCVNQRSSNGDCSRDADYWVAK
jgi:hypothetical protein